MGCTTTRRRFGARLQALEREARGSRFGDPFWAEVRRAREVDDRRPEVVLFRARVFLCHRLDAGGAADPDVGQLGRVVDAEVIREALVGGIQQEVPDPLELARLRVRRVPWVDG